MTKNNYIVLLLISLFLVCLSCREEIELETETFESVLVVEATVTNELKRHQVKLSRSFLLEDSEQLIENNAAVSVTDSSGNSFNFSQNSTGVYISDFAFKALPNIQYTLQINTTDGKTYKSNQQILTPISQIDNLYPEFVNNDVNGPGVQVFLDSNNNNSDTKYFRYEFEETYKIVAPNNYSSGVNFSNFEEVPNVRLCLFQVFYDIDFFDIITEEETCYSSNKNLEIIQTSSNTLAENNISRFPIRFITDDIEDNIIDTSILRDRYSINVRQYIQSIEAYNFYRVLKLLGNNESVLSETQPGFLQGNLAAIGENNDRIIGFFEVASVSERRLFFNYQDVNIELPNYIYDCDLTELNINDNVGDGMHPDCDNDINEKKQLYLLVNNDNYKLVNYDQASGLYTIAKPECVNCTTVGTNIQPDFWID